MNRLSYAAMSLGLAAAPLAAATPAAADPLTAQPACQSRDDINQLLTQRFDEVPTALGLQSNGHLIQVFVSKDGQTWTIVTTRPDGISCIVALGQHWQAVDAPAADPMA
jgi:hypothetical protein